MKAQNIVIRGQKITTNTINGLATRKANALADLGTFANAAAAQAIINGNKNWLVTLTSASRLASGKLDASGKLAVSYIHAHTGGLKYNEKADKWTLGNPERRTIEALADGQTFKATITDFQNAVKAEKPEQPAKPLTGKQLAARISTLLESLQNGLNVDQPEALELAKQAADLFKALDGAITKAAASATPVDTDKAAQLAAIKPTSKERAAPKAKAKGGK